MGNNLCHAAEGYQWMEEGWCSQVFALGKNSFKKNITHICPAKAHGWVTLQFKRKPRVPQEAAP